MSRVKAADEAVSARILIVDIERLPGLTSIWDQRTSGFIPVSRWRRLPSLLCFAAKTYGRRPVAFHAAWDETQEDLARASWELYDSHDIVLSFNGKKFDTPHLRTSWMLAGLPPPSPFKEVDLYQVARRQFALESKSLAHLCARLGLPGKSGHYDELQAEAALDGDEKAQRDLKRYNVGDVRILEPVYQRLLPYITNHPHVATSGGDTLTCNKCGSTDLKRMPVDYRAVVIDYASYRCQQCQGIVRAGHVRRVARTRGIQ